MSGMVRWCQVSSRYVRLVQDISGYVRLGLVKPGRFWLFMLG